MAEEQASVATVTGKVESTSDSGDNLAQPKIGFMRRFLAIMVDAFLILVIFMLVFLVFGSGLSLEGTFAFAYFTNILLSLVYFTYCYATKGQTLGKILLKIKVVSTDGEPLNFAIGIIRYIGYYISGLLIFVGFIMIIFSKDKQGLHDKLAGTYVIKAEKGDKPDIELV